MPDLKPVALKRIRAERAMTRAELARKSRMQAGTITWIEEGRFIPYESQLEKLAAALGVSNPESLLAPLEVTGDGADAA